MPANGNANLTTISTLIGLNSNNSIPTILSDSRLDPDAFPALAPQAAALNDDIRTAYPDALLKLESQERDQDRFFLERAREYVELNDQVDTSASLLTDLASFLSTFQRDLSAVSGHISELQGRSKSIEARLASRRAVEQSLHPFLLEIVIPPKLIDLVMDTEVGLSWVDPIKELNGKLSAIRSGPRVAARKALDDAAEALRVKASQKILAHFLSLLKPFGTSVTISLSDLQSQQLLPLKPLFDFLWQHAARQAHEFQKAYTSTARWYYETGFRRYVRSLEKVRLKSVVKHEMIGNVSLGSAASLALLAKKNHKGSREDSTPVASSSTIDHSKIEGPNPIPVSATTSSTFRAQPEVLFRSLSLVLTSNASTEYSFLSSFFVHHSSLPALTSSSIVSSSPLRQQPSSLSLTSTPSMSQLFSPQLASSNSFERTPRDSTSERFFSSSGGGGGGGGVAASIAGGSTIIEEGDEESGADTISNGGEAISLAEKKKNAKEKEKEDRAEKLRRSVLDGIWKTVMEPALEYSRNFATSLLDPLNPPPPNSQLSMIRLNESLVYQLIDLTSCPSIESYLIGLRLLFWPSFSKTMNNHIDSLHKLQLASDAGTGVFGKGVKDSQVLLVVIKYTMLFNDFVVLSGEHDEEMVFSSVLRLRQELDKLLVTQASKIPDPAKQKAFLRAHYEELLQGLSGGPSTHLRAQTEVAHYKELVRKLRTT